MIATACPTSPALFANVSFFEQGLNQSDPSDDAQVTLTFRDALNTSLGGVSTVVVDSHNGSWQGLTDSFAIPVGARSIDYTMVFLRNEGADNDSFIDDNSLIVSNASVAAPEPGSLALLGMVVFPVAGRIRRRKS